MNRKTANLIEAITCANMSSAAKFVMLRLICQANQQKPHVFVDVEKLSESVGKSASTVRKAIKELVELGHLVFEGLFVQIKHKVYKLTFNFLNKVSRVVEKVRPKRVAQPALKPVLQNEEETKEVIQTLIDFGFEEFEYKEVLSVNGVEKTRALVLEYLSELSKGETLGVKQWFIKRYVEERS